MLSFCMFISSLYIIKEYIIYSSLYGSYFRPFGGTFGDPNYYSLSAIVVLPLIFYIFQYSNRLYLRLLLILFFTIICIAIVMSISRGAFLGLGVMVFSGFIYSTKKKRTFLILFLLTSVALIGAPDRLWERFRDTKIVENRELTGDLASTKRRLDLIYAGLRMIKDKPVFGVGVGQYRNQSVRYEPALDPPGVAHNMYLEITAELGIPAFMFFIGIIIFSLRDLIRIRRWAVSVRNYDLALLTLCIFVSLLGFTVAGTFLSGQNTKIFWVLIFNLISIKYLVGKSQTLTEVK